MEVKDEFFDSEPQALPRVGRPIHQKLQLFIGTCFLAPFKVAFPEHPGIVVPPGQDVSQKHLAVLLPCRFSGLLNQSLWGRGGTFVASRSFPGVSEATSSAGLQNDTSDLLPQGRRKPQQSDTGGDVTSVTL